MEEQGEPKTSLCMKWMPLRYDLMVAWCMRRVRWEKVMKEVTVHRSKDGKAREWVEWKDRKAFQAVQYELSVLGARLSRTRRRD